jgi:hypothetical protein
MQEREGSRTKVLFDRAASGRNVMRRSTWVSRLILSSIPSRVALPRSRGGGLVLAAAVFVGAATRAAGAPSLAGVHWYNGDSNVLDLSVPAGECGYNVEVIFDTGWCDGNPSTDPGDVRSAAATAKAHGLVNIVRVDYRQLQAVPVNSGEYGSWATGLIKCTQELGDLASLFIVGNEPNIEDGGRAEGDIRGDEYASAFNYLYSRKAEMPSTTQLLATGLYARHPQVKGVALWDDGGIVDVIPAFTEYSLQHYFAVPRPSRSALMCAATPLSPAVGGRTLELCRKVSGAGGDAPPAEP